MWGSGQALLPRFLQVQVSCTKEFPDEIEKAFVLNFLPQEAHQDAVVDCVETRLDIALQEPVCCRPLAPDLSKGCMTTASWSEAMAFFSKIRAMWAIVDAFEYHTNYLLHDFIPYG